MATLQELQDALVNADKAGDAEAARKLADAIVSMQRPPEPRYDPTEGMSGWEKFKAGMGQGAAKLGRAVGQGLGFVSDEEIAEANRLDQALLNTGAGKAGSLVGQTMAVAPVAMLPGANTLAGSAIYGGLTGAATTEGGAAERATGALFGAAGGAAGQKLGQKFGDYLASRVAAKPTQYAQNAVRNEAIKDLQQAGYVLPPSAARPTVMNQVVEGIGGKVLTQQRASQMNQTVTNNLARKALGLADDAPITPESLGAIRQQAGQAYSEIAGQGPLQIDDAFRSALSALKKPNERMAAAVPVLVKKDIDALVDPLLSSPTIDADIAVEAIKGLRHESRSLLRAFDDPSKQAAGKAYQAVADRLEDLVDRNLTKAGKPEAVSTLREARQLIAKTYTVEDALNVTTGNVSAQKLAKALQTGKPLSGEIKSIAKMGQAFPKAAQEVDKVGSVNLVNPLEIYAGGAGSLLSPWALTIPVARAGSRYAALSPLMQRSLAKLPTAPGVSDSLLPVVGGTGRRLLPTMGLLGGPALAD